LINCKKIPWLPGEELRHPTGMHYRLRPRKKISKGGVCSERSRNQSAIKRRPARCSTRTHRILPAHADRLDVSAADRRASGQALADSPDPAADTSSDAEVMSMLLDGQMPHHRLEAELGDAMRATGLRRTYVDSWESAVLTARGVGTSIPDPAGGLRAVGLSFIGLSSLVLGMLPSKPALCDLSNAICCCCCSPPRRYP